MILKVARRDVVTARESDSIKDVAGLMEYYNVGCVVVVNKDKPVGIITDRDLALRALNGNDLHTAADVMTRKLRVIREDEGFDRAIELMIQSGVRRLPIVDRSGKLRGIVSMDDLIERLGKNLHGIAQATGRQQRAPAKRAEASKKATEVDRERVF